MDQYKIICDGDYQCGESPIWDARKGKFYWCDLGTARVFTLDETGKPQILFEGKNVGGFAVNKNGGFVCSTLQGIFLWDEQHGFRLIADAFEGEKLVCNDSAADPAGRFLFGSDYYDAYGKYKLGKLFSMEKDGSMKVLDEGIHLSNGIGFSPDNKTLYYTDTITREIFAYDYDVEKGEVSNKRVFVKVPDHEGIPDGMTVDAQGYVWSAQWYGSRVVRYTPDGSVDRVLKTPAKQTTSLIFGGADFTDIYITTAAKPAWLHVIPAAYDYEDTSNMGGAVYKYNLGIQGKAEFIADIDPFHEKK